MKLQFPVRNCYSVLAGGLTTSLWCCCQQEGVGLLHFNSSAFILILSGLAFNGPSSSSPPTVDVAPQQTNGSAPSPPPSHREYRRQLTALNCSVRDWISKHVNDNPLCDLNPIFKDYERHLASIERQHGAGSTDGRSEEEKSTVATPSSSPGGLSAPSAALFSFSKKPTDASAPTATVTFNFGEKVDRSVLGSIGSKPASFNTNTLFGGPAPTPQLSFSGCKPEGLHPAGQCVLQD